MKTKPILFSTPMVQAILDGRKTQTRRIVKDIAIQENTNQIDKEDFLILTMKKSVQKGDILWVRETFQITDFLHPSDENYGYIYKASENGKDWEENNEGWIWKPSIFMPKAACRIFLEVTNVRVERLQEISENDSIAEGIELKSPDRYGWWKDYNGDRFHLCNERESFQTLWQFINGKESWEQNPWVWVYEFKSVEKPVNFI